MQQFAALGYIEDTAADKAKAADSAEVEAKYNVYRTLASGKADVGEARREIRGACAAAIVGRTVSYWIRRTAIFAADTCHRRRRLLLGHFRRGQDPQKPGHTTFLGAESNNSPGGI